MDLLQEKLPKKAHVCEYTSLVEKRDKTWVMACKCGKVIEVPAPEMTESKEGKPLLLG